MSLKQQIRRAVLRDEDLQQWAAVGIERPQAEVRVLLADADGTHDVTHELVVASLRPLLLGLGLPETRRLARSSEVCLALVEQGGNRVGEIIAKVCDDVPGDNNPRIVLLRPERCRHRVETSRIVAARSLRAYHRWRSSKAANPYNFEMQDNDLQSLLMFYVCPRPVVLVSVAFGGQSNIFPMDLIGDVGAGCFTFALRSTSPAVEMMKLSCRLAVSDVPAAQVSVAYQLGKHHRHQSIDWQEMPFSTTTSSMYGLRVPDFALRVREFEIAAAHAIGSHTFFVTRPVSEERRREDRQLHHTPGFYQAYRIRLGKGFSRAV